MKFNSFVFRGVFALILAFPLAAFAADAVLAEMGTAKVTEADIQGEALRIPNELRAPTLAKPEAVQQLATTLLIRRVLATEAEAAGIASDPAVQAALLAARERVLTELMLARMDAANRPPRQVLEALALTNYKANPKRFDLPEEVGASHILIKSDTPDARAKAEAILAELKAGADFATLAKEKSQDGNAKDGGQLGFFPAGRMVPSFDTAVQKMKTVGELSDVVETQFGFHIIKFEGRRSAGVRPFEEVKDVLIREAEAKILNEKRLEQVNRIQGAAKINTAAIESFAKSHEQK